MPKDKNLAKHKSRFEVRGGVINEFDFHQNQGALAEAERDRFARQEDERQLREGETASPAPQTEAERIQQLMDDAHEKVQQRKEKEARKSSTQSAAGPVGRSGAKKKAAKSTARSAGKKSGAKKTAAAKKGAAAATAKKGGAKKAASSAGTAGKSTGKKGASKKRAAGKASARKGAAKKGAAKKGVSGAARKSSRAR
jgi:hypothetical protein